MLMGSVIDKKDSFAALDCFVEIDGDFLDAANCHAWWLGKGEFVGGESETLLGHQQPKMIPISGFSTLEQRDHNLKALDVSLCEEQMKILNQTSV